MSNQEELATLSQEAAAATLSQAAAAATLSHAAAAAMFVPAATLSQEAAATVIDISSFTMRDQVAATLAGLQPMVWAWIAAIRIQAVHIFELVLCTFLALIGVASVCQSPKIRSLGEFKQLVITGLLIAYVAWVAVWAKSRTATTDVNLNPVGLPKIQKVVCLALLIWVWNLATAEHDFRFAFGVGSLAVHLQLFIRLLGYRLGMTSLVPALLSLLMMASFTIVSNSHIGTVFVIIITGTLVFFAV